MSKLIRSTTLFVTGLGASLIVGWWLKNRDNDDEGMFPFQSSVNVPLSKTAVGSVPSEEIGAITLPPEAFVDVDAAMPSEDIIIRSEKISTSDNEKKPAKPKAKSAPSATSVDDLTAITGIGPKTIETLNAMGISTFAALAKADADAIKENLSRVSLATIKGWIKAAKEKA